MDRDVFFPNPYITGGMGVELVRLSDRPVGAQIVTIRSFLKLAMVGY